MQFRREYYCGGTLAWTRELTEAKFFPRHLDADDFAKSLGGLDAGIHARVTQPIDQDEIPERLRPTPEHVAVLPPPPAYPAKKKQRKGASVQRDSAKPVKSQRLWWKEKEAYG